MEGLFCVVHETAVVVGEMADHLGQEQVQGTVLLLVLVFVDFVNELLEGFAIK